MEAFLSPVTQTECYGKGCISYLATIIWNQVPEEIKNSKSVNSFKKKIKQWIPENYPCTLCKTYIKNIGYI